MPEASNASAISAPTSQALAIWGNPWSGNI
jgi:hypothetical protein